MDHPASFITQKFKINLERGNDPIPPIAAVTEKLEEAAISFPTPTLNPIQEC